MKGFYGPRFYTGEIKDLMRIFIMFSVIFSCSASAVFSGLGNIMEIVEGIAAFAGFCSENR